MQIAAIKQICKVSQETSKKIICLFSISQGLLATHFGGDPIPRPSEAEPWTWAGRSRSSPERRSQTQAETLGERLRREVSWKVRGRGRRQAQIRVNSSELRGRLAKLDLYCPGGSRSYLSNGWLEVQSTPQKVEERACSSHWGCLGHLPNARFQFQPSDGTREREGENSAHNSFAFPYAWHAGLRFRPQPHVLSGQRDFRWAFAGGAGGSLDCAICQGGSGLKWVWLKLKS